jgi:NADP-dependent 3-hydroxy acid dehydrogenase YdfG
MTIAIVTGGTKGIGRAIVNCFLDNNYRVYTCARSIDPQFLHENLHQRSVDLESKESLKLWIKEISDNEGVVDILVNNVGVYIPGNLMDEEDDSFEKMININLATTYHATRGCIEGLKKSNKPYIFNICSTASITPYINGGSYCISKYAQYGLTKVLREELKPFKIKVSAVLPGATLTNSWNGTTLPAERFSEPKSIAQLILAAYQLPDSTVMEEILLRPMDGDIS